MLEWIGLLPLLGVQGNWRGFKMGGKFIGGAMPADMKDKFESARESGNMAKVKGLARQALMDRGRSSTGGNPNFRNQTGQYDTESITGVSGKVNQAEVDRLARQFALSDKLPETRLIDLESIQGGGKVTWNKAKIEAVAKSIAQNNGTLLKSPVVERIGVDQYKLSVGANELKAFQRARQLNPNIPDRIRVYEGDPKVMEPFRSPPLVQSSGAKNYDRAYEVVGNASVYRAYEQARKLNPKLPDRFRAYELGIGESIDSLRPQLE